MGKKVNFVFQEGIEQDIEIPEKENWSQRVQSFAILAQEEELHFYVCKFTKAKLSGRSTFAGNDAEKLHLQSVFLSTSK